MPDNLSLSLCCIKSDLILAAPEIREKGMRVGEGEWRSTKEKERKVQKKERKRNENEKSNAKEISGREFSLFLRFFLLLLLWRDFGISRRGENADSRGRSRSRQTFTETKTCRLSRVECWYLLERTEKKGVGLETRRGCQRNKKRAVAKARDASRVVLAKQPRHAPRTKHRCAKGRTK